MRQVLERLLNLLAFLLTAGRPATAEEIRNTVAGYDRGSDEAFRRVFERAKELPRGGGRACGAGGPLAADLGPDVELLAELFEAVSERRMVGFGYRGKARRLAPYGLVHQRGHWYLVGLAGTELRSFRVDRIDNLKVADQPDAFTKPAGFRLRTVLPTAPWEAGEARITASIVFSPEVAWWAERQLSGAAKVRRRKDGSLVVTMPVAHADALGGWLIGFGSAG